MALPAGLLPLLGSVFSSGLGFTNSILGRNQSRQNYENTMRDQRLLAQEAHQRDLEMWHRTNRYNSPEEQMKRLEAAGLNPHLVYGSGQVVGNTQAQMPKYQQIRPESKVTPAQLPTNMLNEFMSLRQMESTNDLTQKQANLLEEKARTEKTVRALKLGELDIQEILEQIKEGELNYQTEMNELKIKEGEKRIEEMGSRMTLQEAQSNQAAAAALNMTTSALKNWQDAIWAKLKNDVYQDSKINIDKDDIYVRALEPLVNWLVQFLEPGTDPGENKPPKKDKDGNVIYETVTDKLNDSYYSNQWLWNIWNSFKDFVKEQDKIKRDPDGKYNPAGTSWNKKN